MRQSELYGNIKRENRRIFSVNNSYYKIIDLYYIIDHPSPLEEIRNVINIPENPSEGA